MVDWDGIAKAKQGERERIESDAKNARESREKFASAVKAWTAQLVAIVKRSVDERNATIQIPSKKMAFYPLGDTGFQVSGGMAAILKAMVVVGGDGVILQVTISGIGASGDQETTDLTYDLRRTGPNVTAFESGGFNHGQVAPIDHIADGLLSSFAYYMS